MTLLKTVERITKKHLDCFLDGITECDKDISCAQCKREEAEWAKNWLKSRRGPKLGKCKLANQ